MKHFPEREKIVIFDLERAPDELSGFGISSISALKVDPSRRFEVAERFYCPVRLAPEEGAAAAPGAGFERVYPNWALEFFSQFLDGATAWYYAERASALLDSACRCVGRTVLSEDHRLRDLRPYLSQCGVDTLRHNASNLHRAVGRPFLKDVSDIYHNCLSIKTALEELEVRTMRLAH